MADERKYYVLCGDKCLFEAMTKEQTLAAIAQAVETGEIKDVDTGFVTTIKEQNRGKGLTFWVGTTAEYNALTEKVQNCFYILTDDTMSDDIEKIIIDLQNSVNNVLNVTQKNVVVGKSDLTIGKLYIKKIGNITNITGWLDWSPTGTQIGGGWVGFDLIGFDLSDINIDSFFPVAACCTNGAAYWYGTEVIKFNGIKNKIYLRCDQEGVTKIQCFVNISHIEGVY